MNNTGHDLPHPITTHLRNAAEHIQSANHASDGDLREVTNLYDTVGALSALLHRLPPLVAHYTVSLIGATPISTKPTAISQPPRFSIAQNWP